MLGPPLGLHGQAAEEDILIPVLLDKTLHPQPLAPSALRVNVYNLTPAAFYWSTSSLMLLLRLLQQPCRKKNESLLSINLAQLKTENPRKRGKAFPYVCLLHISLLRFPNARCPLDTLDSGNHTRQAHSKPSRSL